jgi:mannose-1-phosphate guanylyltransferase
MGFDHYYAVIMAGGGGTRLWPLSRSDKPKQMLALGSTRTLFQQAVDRLRGVFTPDQILVVTSEHQAVELKMQAEDLPDENFIIEPSPRGTAAVVGLAASILTLKDPQAVMAVLTADHIIGNVPLFHELIQAAFEAANENHLVTLGVHPDYPSSGYGYLQRGNPEGIFRGYQAYRVQEFKEKPDLETARIFVASGNYDWNSGMFFWKTDAILREYKLQMPDLFESLHEIGTNWGTDQRSETLEIIWDKIQPQTIDFGIMENAEEILMIPASDLHWNDVGSWDSLFDIIQSDENGIINLTAKSLTNDSKNALIYETNPEKIIASIGMENFILIDTPDALLICHRGETQKIRELVNKLKNEGNQRYL